MLMPRATIQRLTCGAIGLRPVAAGDRAGLDGLEGIERRCRNRCRSGPSRGSPGRAACPPAGRRDGCSVPAALACQISISTSRVGAPLPSKTRPSMRMRSPLRLRADEHVAEILLEDVEAGLARDQADMDVGAGGLRRRFLRDSAELRMASVPLQPVLEQRRAAAAQHDVEAVGEAVERHRGVEVERRDQPLDRAPVRDRRRRSGSAGSADRPRNTSG